MPAPIWTVGPSRPSAGRQRAFSKTLVYEK